MVAVRLKRCYDKSGIGFRICQRDVRQLTAVQNLNDFRKFMVAVAARTGQMLNYANIADEIGKDEKTIKNWISILNASHINLLFKFLMLFQRKNVEQVL